jgi:transcriptional regulator with XRE-family HTH domain
LGTLCQLKKNHVSNVEQGSVNITLASLEALAAGIGCSVATLLIDHKVWPTPQCVLEPLRREQ